MKKKYKLKINDEKYEAKIVQYDGMNAIVNVNGIDFSIDIETSEVKKSNFKRSSGTLTSTRSNKSVISNKRSINAPIPGIILQIKSKEGQHVNSGDILMILEAMKMETEITAPGDGVIKKIHVSVDESVIEDKLLVTMDYDDVEIEEKVVERPAPRKSTPKSSNTAGNFVNAPLPGTILDIKVNVGDLVSADQTLVILEAMKMETEVKSLKAGKVKAIKVSKGNNVIDGQELIELGE